MDIILRPKVALVAFCLAFVVLLSGIASVADASSVNGFGVNSFESITIVAEDDNFTNILCAILCYAQNKFVKFVAIIIVIAVGVGLFVGKVNWGVALATILALALIFSSDSLISSIFSGESTGISVAECTSQKKSKACGGGAS